MFNIHFVGQSNQSTPPYPLSLENALVSPMSIAQIVRLVEGNEL